MILLSSVITLEHHTQVFQHPLQCQRRVSSWSAKDLKQSEEVLIGTGCQQLLKVSKRHKSVEVMEVEFAQNAIVEAHASSILTKGGDPLQCY